MSSYISKRNWDKIRAEIDCANKIQQEGLDSIEIADRLIHDALELSLEGVKMNNIFITPTELAQIFDQTQRIELNLRKKKHQHRINLLKKLPLSLFE